jgi:HrpA-like RNA helicase
LGGGVGGVQVPQYILEAAISRGEGASCSIVCTQPRRIAAMSVAERVAEERGEGAPGTPGSTVGYHVRLEAASTRDTRLLFCTTGGGPDAPRARAVVPLHPELWPPDGCA